MLLNTRTVTYLQGYRYRRMTFDEMEGEQLSQMIESGRGEAEQVTTITRIRRRRRCRQRSERTRQETRQTTQKQQKQPGKQNTSTHSVPLLPSAPICLVALSFNGSFTENRSSHFASYIFSYLFTLRPLFTVIKDQ